MTHTILAYLLILAFIIFFIYDFYKFQHASATTDYYYLSPSTTSALKGLAAIIIICHHFCLYQFNHVDHNLFYSIIPKNGGNFALAIFLFLSGYGVTKSELSKPLPFIPFIKRRIWKILKPCIIISCITLVCYSLFMPKSITPYDVKDNWLNPFLVEIVQYKYSTGLLGEWFITKMDWYVYTTLVLYLLFFLTTVIKKGKSGRHFEDKRIIMLFLLIIVYYVICCQIYPHSKAHYYRNLWAFGLGATMAYKPNLLSKKRNFVWCVICFSFLLLFNWTREGSLYTIATAIAILILIFIGRVNQRYDIRNEYILYLGSISYYLYLCHRTVYNLLWGNGMLNFILFVCLSLFVGVCYFQLHNIIQRCTRRI